MSLTYGFYDSINHDRKYSAEDFAAMFDGVIGNGVFQNVGNNMKVSAVGAGDMRIIVGTGRAWFDRTWTLLDSAYELTVEPADIYLNRIDTVVLETDHSQANRMNRIYIKKGSVATNPVAPTLTQTNEVGQHPLANIYVPAGAYSIANTNITNLVGTTKCPFVTGILKTADLTDLYKKWEEQWKNWFDVATEDSLKSWEEWCDENKQIFNTWFDSIKDTLEKVSDATTLLALVNAWIYPDIKVLYANSWSTQSGQTYPKYQTLEIPRITSTTKPIIDFQAPNDKSAESISTYKKSCGAVDWWETGDGRITFYCSKRTPSVDINLYIRGV